MDKLAFLTYVLVTAITPGPNNIASLSNASRVPLPKAFRFNFGILTGFSIVMLGCLLFTKTLFNLLPRIKNILLIIGTIYMLYLAWKAWNSGTLLTAASNRDGSFLSGFLLQFVNPKIYIYGITALSVYIIPKSSNPLILIGTALFLAAAGFCSTLLWALFGAFFRKTFARHGVLINRVTALLLVYCAISLYL